MRPPPTLITDSDHRRLTELLAAKPGEWDDPSAAALQRKLDRSVVVPSREIPRHVITMGSRFVLRDSVTGGAAPCMLVYPHDDGRRGHVSILSPAGVALLGRPEHDVVEWTVPTTLERVQVRAVSYQPEAADAFWTRADPLAWEV